MEIGASDPQQQWLQLGTAIRMAQSLGLHRDPVDFGFNAIEVETRRRLWAQICILDARLAEHLSEIVQQKKTSSQEREMHLQILREIEQSQEHISPFSPMTFLLIEAEMAREQQQSLCFQYQPRDRANTASTSPQTARGAFQPSGRTDRAHSANELRNRFSIRYNWDRLDCSDPLQYLISELCQINLLKFKFINRSTRGRGAVTPTSASLEHSEVSRYARTFSPARMHLIACL
jgi:hypothetical protein